MRMLALDLDGTSVNTAGQFDTDTLLALEEAKRRGWIVSLVTGRRDVDMLPLGESWRVADYLLLNNGGKTVRAADGAVIRNVLVEARDAARVIGHCLAGNLQIYVLADRRWWVNKMTPQGREYINHVGLEPERLVSVDQVPLDAVEGFMITQDGDAVGRWLAGEGMDLEVIDSEPGCIDVMRAGVTKGAGILALAETTGTPLANIVAVGNYTNDIDMIAAAGVGVAVANALDEVKQAADYVTERDHANGAVAEVVEKFILREGP